MMMMWNIVCSLPSESCWFFFVLPVRHTCAKSFRSPFTHRDFWIFNIHHEEVLFFLLVHAMYMLDWQIFHSWYSQVDKIIKYIIFLGFFMDKIAHEPRCKIFHPQNCCLLLICTNFYAQNYWLLLIAPHGLVYFIKKFQTISKIWKRVPGF
jgi:hypothetical protein